MSLSPPPTEQPIITDQSGLMDFRWSVFFNGLFNGDAGTTWIPTFINLTEVGGVPTVSGIVYQLSQYLTIFFATLTPPPGGSTSGTAGTTAINNFPFTCNGNGVCFAVSGLLGDTSGMVDQASNFIYPPSWTTVTVPLTIIGIVEAS